MSDKLTKVGEYCQSFNELLGTNLPCLDIVQSDGLIKHIQKRHPDSVQYLNKVQEILLSPDYIGANPKETDSIELVKVFSDNILIAVKLDKSQGYYYVASLYDVSSSKLENRINSGRLKKYLTK